MTDSDNHVRQHAITIFNNNISRGNILDFGGGTGLDLPGLPGDKYTVYFLEPSSGMRSMAKKYVSENPQKPIFVEEMSDFQHWSDGHLPFSEKMNGILANFAVFNCIADMDRLFEKLSLICDHKCYIQAMVLDVGQIKEIKRRSLKTAIKILLRKPIVTLNEYKGITQEVYLHTVRKYKSASGKYFNFISYTSIPSSRFALLMLSKK